MEFHAHRYRAGGVTMRYYTAGSGAPLLFLHGGGTKAMTYRNNLELFAQRYYVIAPDIPPFGASDMPPAVWDFRAYAEFFAHFLDDLGCASLFVVGHSYGGGIGLCLAARSARVGRLVVIDAAGVSQYLLRTFFYRYFVVKCIRDLRQKKFGVWMRLQVDFAVNVVKKCRHLLHGVRVVFHALTPQYREQFTRITAPTLILWGEEDEIFPVSTAESLHAMIAHSELRIVAGNHDWCLFNPELLARVLP